jgi:hypothetical protein
VQQHEVVSQRASARRERHDVGRHRLVDGGTTLQHMSKTDEDGRPRQGSPTRSQRDPKSSDVDDVAAMQKQERPEEDRNDRERVQHMDQTRDQFR